MNEIPNEMLTFISKDDIRRVVRDLESARRPARSEQDTRLPASLQGLGVGDCQSPQAVYFQRAQLFGKTCMRIWTALQLSPRPRALDETSKVKPCLQHDSAREGTRSDITCEQLFVVVSLVSAV